MDLVRHRTIWSLILVEIFKSSRSSFAGATATERKCEVPALEVPKTDHFMMKKRCSLPYHCLVFSGPKNSWTEEAAVIFALYQLGEKEEKSENQIYRFELFLSYP